MQFERDFAKAGGLLLAGLDPTGYGGVIAGFGDQREVELLVEAGFSQMEAIHIATANGAEFLGESSRIGTLAPGKHADLVVIHGDPTERISDIDKVEIVFKDGVGYDSGKLVESVRARPGRLALTTHQAAAAYRKNSLLIDSALPVGARFLVSPQQDRVQQANAKIFHNADIGG